MTQTPTQPSSLMRLDLRIAWAECLLRDLQSNGPHYGVLNGVRIAALHEHLNKLYAEREQARSQPTVCVDTV